MSLVERMVPAGGLRLTVDGREGLRPEVSRELEFGGDVAAKETVRLGSDIE